MLKDRIEETGASIAAPILPMVRGDTAQMAHVFQNLLSNALKYRSDSTRPVVRISSESDEQELDYSSSGQWHRI